MPNGCSHSDLFISPNLKTLSAKNAMKKEWYVGCKFYDPIMKAKYPKGYFWRKKGLAEYKTFEERKEAAEILLDEMSRALDMCYNPIPGVCKYQPIEQSDFSPNLYLMEALEVAFTDHKTNISPKHASCIESNLNIIKPVVIRLGYDKLIIKDTELKHIKKILDNCNLSAFSYNRYKIHLSTLFKILCINSCLIQNPCQYIPTKQHIKKERKILTQEEFDKIYNYLIEKLPNYANYMLMFHMSGCRSTELLEVKKSDVNLENQEFTITVKKRQKYVREIRAIIPDALPYWKSQLDLCSSNDDYIFGVGFSPESRSCSISNDAPGKYWERYVNKVFHTETTFYSLKHFFLDKVEKLHGITAAQNMAGHLNGKTTEIYTVYKKRRELEELKNLSLKTIEQQTSSIGS